MRKLIGMAAVSLAAQALSGCHTVPTLTPELTGPSEPTVNDIAKHIACEIYKSGTVAKLSSDQLSNLKNEVATVLLTLQVDDTVDLTPSLALTRALTPPAVSLVTTLNADIGGARQRTFTTSYSFDVGTLLAGTQDCRDPKENLYSLGGNLQIAEIIKDGLNLTSDNTAYPYVVHVPKNATDKSGPSFGSKVQFIITQSITNVGPVWTLKYFKGGGGASGLFNGKRLDTDNVLITFAPKPPPTPPTPNTNKALEDAINALTAAIERQQKIVATHKAELEKIQRQSDQLSAHIEIEGLNPKPNKDLQAQLATLQAQEVQKTAEIKAAEDTLDNTRAIAEVAEATKQSLNAAAPQPGADQSVSAAASATQQLQLNMLLQNLTVGH